MGAACGQPISHPSQAQEGNSFFGGPLTYYSYRGYASQALAGSSVPVSHGLMHPSGVFPNSYPFNAQPVYPLPNAPIYPNQAPSGLFADYTGCVTPFVRWIEDYPFLDGLKMPSNVGSYDRKGDSNNFLYLFEGAIRNILNYEDLKAKFRSHFSQQKKFTKTHLAVHNIKQREGKSTRAFVTRYTNDTLQILGLNEEQRISGSIHRLQTRSRVKFLSIDLPTSYKGLMEKTYTWIEAKEVVTNGTPNDRRENSKRFKRDSSWDNNKGNRRDIPFSYHGGIKKGKTRVSDTQQGIKKENKETTPVEAPVLMISRHYQTQKMKSARELINRLGEITFPLVSGSNNSSDLVIIKARISGREVRRVYIDSGSSCEVIYEHCFLKLKPALQPLRVDSRVLLVGFSGEHSWPLGEVPLEVTIGDSSLTRMEVLNFVIIRSNSPHNLLLGRTAMQRMGIVVSIIYEAIKFHTPKGIGTVLSTYEPPKRDERKKKPKATCLEIAKNVRSCGDAEERIIVNTKYPEQMIAIGK
ncbi:reverse transcriptase domain-containing protein [Tanacetum coccineum]